MTNIHTIADIQAVIEQHRVALDRRGFLVRLDDSSDVEDLRAMTPQMYFYVGGFQDMLRLTHESIHDPDIKEIAAVLRMEDAGHERWFFFDASQLGCARDVEWLFGVDHATTRDIVYSLIGELLRATDDRVRIVFPLLLEAAGSVFFRRVVGLLKRAGFNENLRYFARSHQEAEAEHEIFTENGQGKLDEIEFNKETFEEAVALVSRCFSCFERFADHLGDQLDARQRLQASNSQAAEEP